ncbi:acyl-CoA dehydrogenase [soil metagenome]
MNTFLSSGQLALQEQYLKFVAEQIAPLAMPLDTEQVSSKEALSLLAKGGYLGLTVPREYGGQGLGALELTLFAEALATASAGLSLALASHYSVIELINKFGSDTQKSRYLSQMASGDLIGAQAFCEEMAGSDFKAVQTTAKGDSASGWQLNGEKTWVVNGQLAGLIAVLAKVKSSSDSAPAADSELAIFLVDGSPSTSIEVGANRAKFGLRSASTCDLTFREYKATSEHKLASATSAELEKQVNAVLDLSKTVVAAAAVGIAEEALKFSAEHARTREQFGQPISKFQGIQWKLADHSVESQAARLLTYRAAWSHDEEPADFRKFAAMAKLFATKVARVHSGEAVQIFGMLGASPDSPVERLYRDGKLTEVFEGTSELQKVVLKEELGV